MMIYHPYFRLMYMTLQALTATSVSHPGVERRKYVKATFSEFILSHSSYYDGWFLQRGLWCSGYTVTEQNSAEHMHNIQN